MEGATDSPDFDLQGIVPRSIRYIFEAIKHAATTKKYLAGFEQDAIKQTTDVLISFKKGDMEKCA